MQRPDDLRGVGHLVRLVAGGEGHDHFALAHGNIHRPEVEKGMAEAQYALAVVVRHGAEAGDGHVAIHQDAGDAFPRVERMLPSRRGLVAVDVVGRAPLHRVDSHLLEHRTELAQGAIGETREHQRRFDGDHHGRGQRGAKPIRQAAQKVGTDRHGAVADACFVGRVGIFGPRFIQVVDLQHQFDGGDPADGIGREGAHTQGHRSDEFPVDVDRTATHAAGHVGDLGLAVHLGDDNVLVGSVLIAQAAHNLDRHGFRHGALEDRPRYALHAGLDGVEFHDFHRSGFGADGRRIGCK